MQSDIELARREARLLARELLFGREDAEALALVVSELASNLVRHAVHGQIELTPRHGPRGTGLEITSRDQGPGIVDVQAALRDGFSTAGGLGCGLGGVQRLTDEFEVISGPSGTTVVCRKWLPTS
jgi:serine/threonine-protein kinase RsbT